MSTVQNGKGDRPRNNWGPEWYAGYAAINWHQQAEVPNAEEYSKIPSIAGEASIGNSTKLRNQASGSGLRTRASSAQIRGFPCPPCSS